MVKMEGYTEEAIEHSKKAADKRATELRSRGYGARVVVYMKHKGKAIAWTVMKSNRKIK